MIEIEKNDAPSLAEIDGRIMALIEQRNVALNEAVVLSGHIRVLKNRVAELEKTVAQTVPAVDELQRQ